MKCKLHSVYIQVGHVFLAGLVWVATSCTKESIENVNVGSFPKAENVVAVEQELLLAVNDHRAALGQTVLEYSAVAHKYADNHNDYMIAKGDLSHDNFSARASSISSEVNAEYVAENVAKDYDNAQEALEGWLNSSSHKKTMEGEFTHTAVSVKKDANGNFYFTQLFYR